MPLVESSLQAHQAAYGVRGGYRADHGELLELIGLSHRIAVMRAGRVTAILHAPPDKKPTERELVGLMLGTYSGVS
jgi:hypothetical protein